jgi:Transcriptional regulatory protein, C terminal/AAA-like domain
MRPIELNFPNPIETGADLFDREQELRRAQDTLRSSTRRPVVIMGERVMGKTSLLNVVVEWAMNEQQLCVLRLPHVDSRIGFAEEILDGIAGEVATSLHRQGLRDEHGKFLLSTTAEFDRVAAELGTRGQGTCFLLCLEELDSMLVKCRDDASRNQILDFVVHMVNHTSLPIRFVFTMTKTPEQILRSDASPFMSAARITHLAPWTFEQSRDFATWLFEGDVRFHEEAQEQLFAACGGHPYLTKAVLQTLHELYADEAASAAITLQQMRSAITATVASPELDFTLENIVKVHFSAEELSVLRQISSRPTGYSSAELGALGGSYLDVAHELHRRRYLRSSQADGFVQAFGLLTQWLKGKPWADGSRPAGPAPPADDGDAGRAGGVPTLLVNESKKRAFLGAREISLTAQEYRFLRCLAEHAGSVVDRYTVATEVWPGEVVAERESRLDALVYRLREELGSDATKYVETRRGRGYYLNPDFARLQAE